MTGDDDNPSKLTSETFDVLLRDIARSESKEPPSKVDLTGSTLGHYRIAAELGRGGMGIVYHAEDSRLARDVALKVLRGEVAGDDERRQRFLREARAAAAINHPNIATVYEVGDADGRLFLAMERVDGSTLRAKLGGKSLPSGEALGIARQIARGLARAHERGVVHRDLKPENVMITREGDVKILDFGLAKLREASSNEGVPASTTMLTQEGRVMGTPGYMSPEQATGKAVDARTDVYAFGVVLHEMLTGELPGALGTGRVAADPKLASIIARCLARAPEDRWTAREALAALEALAIGDGAASWRSTATQRPRARARWLALGIAALLAVGVTAVVLRRSARPSENLPIASAPAIPSALEPVRPPLPAEGNPEAIEAYREALAARRGGEPTRSKSLLLKATELDPSLAEPPLELALFCNLSWESTRARALLAQAEAHRDTLAPRDRALLLATEALLARDPVDIDAFVGVLIPIVDRYPRDVALRAIFASALLDDGRLDDASRELDGVLALDPGFAQAWALRASVADARGDPVESRRIEHECAERFPRAMSCLLGLAELDASLGRCGDMESDVRREIAVDPEAEGVYQFLVDALASQGRPREMVTATLEQELLRSPVAIRESRRLAEGWQIEVTYGRFEVADAMAREFLRARPNDLEVGRMAWGRRAMIAEEEGIRSSAATILREVLRRQPTWVDREVFHGRLLAIALHVGAIERATFDREVELRRAHLAANADPLPVDPAAREAALLARWVDQYADVAVSRGDVDDALQRFDAAGFHADVIDDTWSAQVGDVLFRGGRAAEAVPHLRRAANNCDITYHPDDNVRANLQLGEALEATGDASGACAAYARVLFYWGGAPHSVTAAEARARSKALACATGP